MTRHSPRPAARLRTPLLLIWISVASLSLTAHALDSTHRVLAILVNVPGRKPLQSSRAEVARALFARKDSVSAHYRAMSYGQLDFHGGASDVIGPLTLPEPPGNFCETGDGSLADAADAAARARGIDPSRYDHVIYLIPSDMPCSWTGLGLIGGRRVWAKAATVRLLQHELGHNLGLDHALRWSGSSAESSDIMGSADLGLNAPHLVQLGLLASFPGKQIEATAAQTFTLETIEADPTKSPRPKVIVVTPASGANTYYLSYRADAGTTPDEYANGVNIHIYSPGTGGQPFTYFVGALPDGGKYEDGPLVIRQQAHVPGKEVRFEISFDGAGPMLPAGAPPAAAGTIQSAATGKCLDVARGSLADGAPVIQYDCHDGPNQKWRVESSVEGVSHLVNARSGKCLAAAARGTRSPGTALVQRTCGEDPSQQWILSSSAGDVVLQLAHQRLCADVPRASRESGIQVVAWGCLDGPNQHWRIRAMDVDAALGSPDPGD